MNHPKLLLQMLKNQRSVFVQLLTGLLLLLVFNLTACGSSSDQSQMITVGVVNLASVHEPIFDGFKDGLTELGYVEGENITYIYDGPVGDVAKLEAAVQALVDQDVDLILALSTPGALAAMQVTQETPIIFAPMVDPLRAGLVSNLARPDANGTGVQWGLSEPRRLEWLLTLAPDIQKIYLPYNPDDSAATTILEDIQDTADKLGIELVLSEARNEDEITAVIENIPEDADAMFLLPDSLLVSRMTEFAEAAVARKLPLTAPGDTTVEAGGLMSYSMGFYPIGQQSARLAHQIFQGVAVGDLPVETADFFLGINLKTANAIELEISDDILRQANMIVRE